MMLWVGFGVLVMVFGNYWCDFVWLVYWCISWMLVGVGVIMLSLLCVFLLMCCGFV